VILHPAERRMLAFLLLVLAVSIIVGLTLGEAKAASQASPPPQAERYRRDLIRSARYVFGMSAPVAVLAAQVHQESAWRPEARSAYASGLAQFTPATASDMARLHQDLRSAAPLDPRWALLALCKYDKAMLDAASYAATPADRWAFALAAYNGGPGWIPRDRAAAKAQGLDPARWWGNVERANGGRAPQFLRENRDYPHKIIVVHQPRYRSWGPGVDMEDAQ